jgi:hypothetical protein
MYVSCKILYMYVWMYVCMYWCIWVATSCMSSYKYGTYVNTQISFKHIHNYAFIFIGHIQIWNICMYACMCVNVSTHIRGVQDAMSSYMWYMPAYICMPAYLCTYTHILTFRTGTVARPFVSPWNDASRYLHTCMHVCMYRCICMYIYIYYVPCEIKQVNYICVHFYVHARTFVYIFIMLYEITA